MKRYLRSQSGAALILVLFLVLFLSIVGTVLLNATTYSQKSIHMNSKVESEFYKAEGALDLALYTIQNHPTGMYKYLTTPSTEDKELFFSIEEANDMKVRIENINSKAGNSSVSATLTASLADSTKSKLDRKIDIFVEEPGAILKNPIIYWKKKFVNGGSERKYEIPSHFGETVVSEDIYNRIYNAFHTNKSQNRGNLTLTHSDQLTVGTIGIDGQVIDEYVKYGNLNISSNIKNNGGIYVKSGSYLEFNELDMKNGGKLVIEEGAIVVGNSATFSAAHGQIIIKGVFIVNDFTTHSHSSLIVDSAIIARNYNIKSLTVTGLGKGIDLRDFPRISDSAFPSTLSVENYKTIR